MSIPSRTAESRHATARASIGGEAKGRLDIDLTGLPPDMEACWIRESIMGQRDDNNISDALNRQGYECVPPDMLTNTAVKRLPGEVATSDQILRRSGHILMMRPIEIADEARAVQRDEVARQKNAAIRVSESSGAMLGSEAFKEIAPVVSVRSPGRPRGFKE